MFLYNLVTYELGRKTIVEETDIPSAIKENLNPQFELRPYQEEAFKRFLRYYEEDHSFKKIPIHLLFNMATGSGKTLIMAGLIAYLYEQGYRNFLFFVNSTNIIRKTEENFLNYMSSKYQFNPAYGNNLVFKGKRAEIFKTNNFEGTNPNDVNIIFTTIQKLHGDLTEEKENSITYEDFKNKEIVFIGDEAHHMNVATKAQRESLQNWEKTVERLFNQNHKNILLEFTATIDYEDEHVANKYKDKVLYRYDLINFRNDGYSKDVHIVQSDFGEKDRILQALILNQYKQEVAAKNKINLKPVILFKAQKTIKQSQDNKEKFHQLIDELAPEDITNIRKKSNINLVERAFRFFDDNIITPEQLTARLKKEFHQNYCLSVNEEKEKEEYQLLLNSLEDMNNNIRAVFAVHKLNEGWDVLNLFDIVRCYTARDSKAGKPGKTTISEAQLIGRGARYFPFNVRGHERYKRKFDGDLTSELRVLEELHYHSINDSRYISELRTALTEEGMMDEREVRKELTLKESFKETVFYKHGLIYINDQIPKDYSHVESLSDFGVKKRNFRHFVSSGKGATEVVFDKDREITKIEPQKAKDVPLKNIERHIIQNALLGNIFYTFDNLKEHFPNLKSMDEFIDSEKYLSGLEITFMGGTPSIRDVFDGVINLLVQLEGEIKENITCFEGSDFKPHSIQKRFYDKILKLKEGSERANGDEGFVEKRDWYVFNANYGTSEEKDFVRLLDRQVENLEEYYSFYLLRNERFFKIYRFSDGKPFEPDFVLFLRKTNGKILTYQIFVEPKGPHLKESEKWKQDFLKELASQEKTIQFNLKHGYKILGVPFYTADEENEFKEALDRVLNEA